ncbi:MAG TPA: hypothetical protein VKS22_16990 [Candidatus Binataceae bacterium]|nr:hypothetical protein [Candidatus Binataceae bacterium]
MLLLLFFGIGALVGSLSWLFAAAWLEVKLMNGRVGAAVETAPETPTPERSVALQVANTPLK